MADLALVSRTSGVPMARSRTLPVLLPANGTGDTIVGQQALNCSLRIDAGVSLAAPQDGRGGFSLIGTPDQLAGGIPELHAAGFAWTTLSCVDYVEEFPYFPDTALPKLQAAGIRQGTERWPTTRPGKSSATRCAPSSAIAAS